MESPRRALSNKHFNTLFDAFEARMGKTSEIAAAFKVNHMSMWKNICVLLELCTWSLVLMFKWLFCMILMINNVARSRIFRNLGRYLKNIGWKRWNKGGFPKKFCEGGIMFEDVIFFSTVQKLKSANEISIRNNLWAQYAFLSLFYLVCFNVLITQTEIISKNKRRNRFGLFLKKNNFYPFLSEIADKTPNDIQSLV